MTYTTAEIDDIKFVKAWITKQTVDEVCRKMRITPQQAYVKANSLRKKGVNLPKKKAPHVVIDKTSVEELNKLIERMSK